LKRIKKIIFLAVNALLIICAAASFIGMSYLGGLLQSQKAAQRWAGQSEQRMAQISCFLPRDGGIEISDVLKFRQDLDKKLQEASLEAPEGGSLYTDAYCAAGEISVTGARGGATVTAIGVGGDFFLFHPMILRSGSFIYSDDPTTDKVVLDEELAWRLFGSSDLAGMTVTIGGEPYIVAGVVSRESDFASRRAYTGGEGIYMSFEALAKNVDAKIRCYEIAMPDPVSGFAAGIVKEIFPLGDGVLVENSGRFKLSKVFSIIRNFGERSVHNTGVILPSWENAARIVEDYMALFLAVGILLSILPAICLLVLIIRLLKKLKRQSRKLRRTLADRWDDFRTGPRRKKSEKSEGTPETKPAVRETPVPAADSVESEQEDMLLDIEAIVREVLEEEKTGKRP
jgi:hypothetical protein